MLRDCGLQHTITPALALECARHVEARGEALGLTHSVSGASTGAGAVLRPQMAARQRLSGTEQGEQGRAPVVLPVSILTC